MINFIYDFTKYLPWYKLLFFFISKYVQIIHLILTNNKSCQFQFIKEFIFFRNLGKLLMYKKSQGLINIFIKIYN